MNNLINTSCLDYLNNTDQVWDCIFSDCPDNIGLKYSSYNDNVTESEYIHLLDVWIRAFIKHTKTLWFSYNAKWTFHLGKIITTLLSEELTLEAKHCIQVFTFGQHNHNDLGNNHRPLLRLRWKNAPLYPNQIRVPSWRQLNGDKRADPRGRVPGDVFDFPRVTGNSKQRRTWHPTQLHEGLIERCIKLCTKEGDTVLDPFAGTGTTLRVCERINRDCTLIELDKFYCEQIAKEHSINVTRLD